MSQIKLSDIRKELMKIKDYDSLKKEVKKLIAEIEKFDLKKSIPEDKMKYIEKKYNNLMGTINDLQSKLEKEVEQARKKVSKTTNEAVKIISETRDMAMKQKKELEKTLSDNFNYFKKKASTSIEKEEKNLRKTIKKVRVGAVSTAKKTLKKKKITK
jgi:F0F1-type ATP synthase membrane subunit b/b'